MRRNYLAPGGEGVVLPEMGSFFRPHVYDIVSPHVKGIQGSLGFWIPIVSGIPDSISKIFPDSGIRILLNGANWYGFYQRKYLKG